MSEQKRADGSVESIGRLSRVMRSCRYPKADIVALARRLREQAGAVAAAADDVAALKVEKNALALLFIPEVAALVEALVAAHPATLFGRVEDRLEPLSAAAVRASLGGDRVQAQMCAAVHASLRNAFQVMADHHLAAVEAAAGTGADLLLRYRRALGAYHGHTAVASTHFTPAGHLMAGVNTALFFILRAVSALTVLGERALGRPLSAGELAQATEAATPLLLTIARCHLELLLELEGPLGKGDDLYMMGRDDRAYADALAGMFVVTATADGLRLDLAPGVIDGLPHLGGDKPRTGCPALYAATADNVNVIVALVRLVGRSFADLAYG